MSVTERRNLDGRALYECDSCGTLDAWGSSWGWFGSYRQLEDRGMKGVEPIICACSKDCLIALVAAGKIPQEHIGSEVA